MGILTFLEAQTKINYKALMNSVWYDPDLQNAIIQLNTRSQLFNKGIDSDGDTLGDYSQGSVDYYGKRAGHIQLFDTGEFYKSFKIVPLGEDVEIQANTIKVDGGKTIDITDRFGIEIIGLTNESKEVLSNIISEITTRKLREYLQDTR